MSFIYLKPNVNHIMKMMLSVNLFSELKVLYQKKILNGQETLKKQKAHNKALQWTPIPLRSIGATELSR